MQSLLGLFYSRIKGSQEDIASEGLAYILQRSPSARLAVSKLIKADCGLDIPDLSYVTQSIGEKLERPDISGFDIFGKEILILEAKFWAALTDNQPIGYLERLPPDAALVFICPTLRVRPVYEELVKRLVGQAWDFEEKPELHSLVLQHNKHLVVKTWNEILGTIRLHLVQANEQALLSDIDQIIGLCDTIDSNSFLPLQSEDLSPSLARRINSYYDLVDKVVDELKKRGFADTIGLKMTPQKYGYTRFLNLGRFGVSLMLKFDFWAKHADTPFWITVKERTSPLWTTSADLRMASKKAAMQLNFRTVDYNQKEVCFALFPLLDTTEDHVVSDLTDQILKLSKAVESQMSSVKIDFMTKGTDV